ncbi:MAG: Coenzyme F420 hydrogenase/dehydrogenase, beta subunit C-terminal domain [Thermodesulfobacteriota bacterium]
MTTVLGLSELASRVLDKGLCAACGACVGKCPYLVKFHGRTVKLDSCKVEQGRCHAYCPMTFFDEEAVSRQIFGLPHDRNGLGSFIEVKASRSSLPEVLSRGQGGGTVTTLLLAALRQGLIDSAVLTAAAGDDGFPYGVVAVNEEQIQQCSGSKFVGAHSLEGLRLAIDQGFKKIGIVGLPCQVRSARKMAMYDLKQEGLRERITLVVGLFCNWAFDPREFASVLRNRTNGRTIRKLDIPPPPANILEIETDQGVETISLDELRPIIQRSCGSCSDMVSEFADVSLGMFEGRPKWNTLIVRTPMGRDLVAIAEKAGMIETEPFPAQNLEHLRSACVKKKNRVIEVAG